MIVYGLIKLNGIFFVPIVFPAIFPVSVINTVIGKPKKLGVVAENQKIIGRTLDAEIYILKNMHARKVV